MNNATTAAQGPEPSLLSHMKAAFSEAKERRSWFWRLEVTAAVLAVVGAFVPIPIIAAIISVAAVSAKAAAKLAASAARSIFRQAERARRYDFEARTLGWLVPAHEHGELMFSFSREVESRAKREPVADADYYATQGPPGTIRLFANLAESMLWTENLAETMSRRRASQLALAIMMTVLALVGLVLVQPAGVLSTAGVGAILLGGLRIVGAGIAALIAIDVYGELGAYGRSASECRKLFLALEAALRAPEPARDEGLRLLVEYNCVLVELPMVPDEVHQKERDRLNKLWEQVSARLPRIGTSVSGGAEQNGSKQPEKAPIQ